MVERHSLNLYGSLTDAARAVLPAHVRRRLAESCSRLPYKKQVGNEFGGVVVNAQTHTLRDRTLIANSKEELGGDTAFVELVDAQEGDGFVLDIGGSIGMYTGYALQRGLHVTVFEPDPQSLSRLEENVRLNEQYIGQVQIVNVAVSDENSNASLYSDGLSYSCPSLEPTLGQKGQVDVQTFTLDTLILEGLISRPTIIKIDVEGAEGKVLEGGKEYFRSPNAADVVLEIHPSFLEQFGTDAESIITRMTDEFGYRVKSITEKKGEMIYHFSKP